MLKRSPGIDKANKLTYCLSVEMLAGGVGAFINLECIPVCVMIVVYFLYMPWSTTVLTGTLCSFDKMVVGVPWSDDFVWV